MEEFIHPVDEADDDGEEGLLVSLQVEKNGSVCRE